MAPLTSAEETRSPGKAEACQAFPNALSDIQCNEARFIIRKQSKISKKTLYIFAKI